MKTCIALFRGINVGGHGILPMKALRALLEGLGLAGVKTHLQSGNAVFRCTSRDSLRLAREIADAVLKMALDMPGSRPAG